MVNNVLNVVITTLCNFTTNWVATEQCSILETVASDFQKLQGYDLVV